MSRCMGCMGCMGGFQPYLLKLSPDSFHAKGWERPLQPLQPLQSRVGLEASGHLNSPQPGMRSAANRQVSEHRHRASASRSAVAVIAGMACCSCGLRCPSATATAALRSKTLSTHAFAAVRCVESSAPNRPDEKSLDLASGRPTIFERPVTRPAHERATRRNVASTFSIHTRSMA